MYDPVTLHSRTFKTTQEKLVDAFEFAMLRAKGTRRRQYIWYDRRSKQFYIYSI